MEVFINFKDLFLSVWDQGILGIDIGQILIGLGIFGFLLFSNSPIGEHDG